MLAPIPPPAAFSNDKIFKIGDSTTSLFCRDLGAVAHYEERRAYERLGKRAASGPNMDTWAALGICRFRHSGTGRECSGRLLPRVVAAAERVREGSASPWCSTQACGAQLPRPAAETGRATREAEGLGGVMRLYSHVRRYAVKMELG